ncbi:cytochrome P450 [Nonomuraea aurantiaca]|jgi:pentalenolactone synthase|uniref:cytochrome P450 n=1 Tax=Nonomuraea aurantiaca TaxID=2878562 RepID=UPI001CDA1858|nr:cytochrome P450 [Nonomuraea aurantiaca]MCA2228138.1 cytochrome P450 [Nonomuraea aurantiaca]
MPVNKLPFEQPELLRPAPLLRALQAEGPVHRVQTGTGDDAWLVTGYEEVRRLLDDDRLGRSHPDPENAARIGESALFGGPMGDFDTEREDHIRMRAVFQPHFSPKRMRAFRPRVEELTDQLLDELERQGSPADLHQALALPLPILVICELLGVPYEDRDQFRAWTEAAGNTADHARSMQGLIDLYEYGKSLVERKRHTPGDDVISRMIALPDTDDDEIARRAMNLLFAGHETTVVQIGMGALYLLANSEQWDALRAEPELLTGAIEEILRAPMVNGAGGIPRYARVDLEIGEVTVRAGELVLLHIGMANHDEKMFADPERFDVTREAMGHVSFGYGARYCIGAPLARLELQAVFARLIPRFPGMRLAVPVEELRVRADSLTSGLVSLPVKW